MPDYLHVSHMDGNDQSSPPIEEWPQSVWAMEAAAGAVAAAAVKATPRTAPEPPVAQSTPVAAPPAEQEK